MPELVVLVGPIASGKSSVAEALGVRFRQAGRPVSVLDLDDVVQTIGGFADLTPQRFRQAQGVYGRLVAAWLELGFDVIAHGPFFDRQEDEAVLHAVPAGIEPRRVRLLCTLEVALQRVAADPDRDLSKDPTFLGRTYQRVDSLLPTMPPCEWSFDTTTMAVEEIVDELVAGLLSQAD